MPPTEVFFYQDGNGRAPVLEWLQDLRREDRKAYAKCVARIRRLAEAGHELRRPEADYLRDETHELRGRRGRVNYRILYFFHGQHVAILTHALTKEGEIPGADIERAKSVHIRLVQRVDIRSHPLSPPSSPSPSPGGRERLGSPVRVSQCLVVRFRRRKEAFECNPERHPYEEDVNNG